MTINRLTVDFMGKPVTLVARSTDWPTGGELWELGSYLEVGKRSPTPSNFCAVTLVQYAGGYGGQTNWVLLQKPEMDLLMRVNGIVDQNETKWRWLVNPRGSIYLLLNNEEESAATELRWPRIAIGSKGDGDRNLVKVIGASIATDGTVFARISGIPRSANYNRYSLESTPWFFHRVYCIYQNTRLGDTPRGVVYMPIFDPASGFKASKGPQELWIDGIWLKKQVG
jgi:hypothetical protein